MDPNANPDASDPEAQQLHSLVIRQELDWAAHLGMQACIVSLQAETAMLAHILSQVCIPARTCSSKVSIASAWHGGLDLV